jgi:hypothetical protein
MPPPSAATASATAPLDLRLVARVGDDGDDGRAGLVDELGRARGEPLGVAREQRQLKVCS